MSNYAIKHAPTSALTSELRKRDMKTILVCDECEVVAPPEALEQPPGSYECGNCGAAAHSEFLHIPQQEATHGLSKLR